MASMIKSLWNDWAKRRREKHHGFFSNVICGSMPRTSAKKKLNMSA
jgi:hypothetical protein